MYLYFNKEGILTTSIPHGEPVRQGSFLNIYICLDSNFFENDEDRKQHSINVELTLPNGIIGTTKCVPEKEPSIEYFKKTNDSEVTYDLIDGMPYWTYHFRFTPETSTNYPGLTKANISIIKTFEDEYGEVMQVDKVQFGETQIFIEKTFGFGKKIVDNSTLHYENLILQINEINKKVDMKNPMNADSTFVGENEPKFSDEEQGYYNVWLDLGELGDDEVEQTSTFNFRENINSKTSQEELIEVIEKNKTEKIVVLQNENDDAIIEIIE